MSQPNPPKNAEPILHRYDPQQPVVLPKTGDATVQPPALDKPTTAESPDATAEKKPAAERPVEIGGPAGLEPTRYGDWERNGRVSDF